MAVAPELVDLSRSPKSRKEKPLGAFGENPHDSTAAYGGQPIETTLALIGSKQDELGV